jgi:hypothetical protein
LKLAWQLASKKAKFHKFHHLLLLILAATQEPKSHIFGLIERLGRFWTFLNVFVYGLFPCLFVCSKTILTATVFSSGDCNPTFFASTAFGRKDLFTATVFLICLQQLFFANGHMQC